MLFNEEHTQPDPTRWMPDGTWPQEMFKGRGLFEDFVALLQVSGYFRLYFFTGDSFEHIGDYLRYEDFEEAALQLLSSMAQLPDSAPADLS